MAIPLKNNMVMEAARRPRIPNMIISGYDTWSARHLSGDPRVDKAEIIV